MNLQGDSGAKNLQPCCCPSLLECNAAKLRLNRLFVVGITKGRYWSPLQSRAITALYSVGLCLVESKKSDRVEIRLRIRGLAALVLSYDAGGHS